MKEPVYLFVYGTLRKEFGSAFSYTHEGEMEWLGAATISGQLYDIGDYPGAIEGIDADSIIIGEVICVKNPQYFFNILDQYENYDPLNADESEYVRRQVVAMMDDGSVIDAWVYWYNRSIEEKTKIEGNNYINYLKNKLRESEVYKAWNITQ